MTKNNSLNDLNTFGKRLRFARSRAKMTQEQLADIVGTTHQYIGKMERDEAGNPDRGFIVEIAKTLEVAPGWLIYGHSELDHLSREAIDLAIEYQKLTGRDKEIIKRFMDSIRKKD